jgi:hypothetical protein
VIVLGKWKFKKLHSQVDGTGWFGRTVSLFIVISKQVISKSNLQLKFCSKLDELLFDLIPNLFCSFVKYVSKSFTYCSLLHSILPA